MGRKNKTRRMIMTIERTDGDDFGPTGQLRVVDLRPASIFETACARFRSLFKKSVPDYASLAGISLELGTPVSVGIELSPDTYAKLIGGNTKAVQAIDLLRGSPISMSVVVAPACIPGPSLEEVQQTVV